MSFYNHITSDSTMWQSNAPTSDPEVEFINDKVGSIVGLMPTLSCPRCALANAGHNKFHLVEMHCLPVRWVPLKGTVS